MNSLRSSAVTAAMMLSFAMTTATAGEPARDPREVMVGQYACSAFPASGPQTRGSVMITGTSGLFISGSESNPINVAADFEPGGQPVCDAFATAARTRLVSLGCTASQISAVDPGPNNTWSNRSLQFVCSGPRDKMVDALASLVELIVTNQR